MPFPLPEEYIHRFTKTLLRVITISQEEALRFNNEYIWPTDILRALIRVKDSAAAQLLLDKFYVQHDNVIPFITRGQKAVLGEMEMTPQARLAIDRAVEFADRRKSQKVSTLHVLAGLFDTDKTTMAILMALDVQPDEFRNMLLIYFQSNKSDPD